MRNGARLGALARGAVVALVLGACSTGASTPSASTHAGVSQSPSEASMTEPAATPVATPDAARFATASGPPEITVRTTEAADGVTVTDLAFGDADIGQTDAYLVAPETGATGAAVIWFHWLESGAPTSNRTEFLAEAKGLAQQGAVSLLVQGTLPWLERPSSIAHDVPLVEREVKMLRRGIDLLVARDDVDPARIAVVGHDFGGMYGSLLFGADARVRALVVMTPTARWGDWFAVYWAISDPTPDYLAALAPLDPLTWLPEADGRPLLLQFASDDRYVPEEVAAEISAAAGPSAETRTYDAEHELNEAARVERDAWLSEVLGLPAAS